MMTQNSVAVQSEDELFVRVTSLIEESRKQVAKAVNTAMVYTYYGVGQYIVEYEQGGNARAQYGKGVLNRLSERLTEKYGNGWSVETLTKCRKFYMVYSISSTVGTKLKEIVHSGDEIKNDGQRSANPTFILPWSQDLGQMLMYVNYFDRYKRQDFEKPTIGILLCKDKNDALVELTLPKEANIYAQQYALCLPDKELLQQKLCEWYEEFEELKEKEEEV